MNKAMQTNTKTSKQARAQKYAGRILEIAQRMADEHLKRTGSWALSTRIEEIRLHTNYAERGYDQPKSGLIAVGNWNKVDRYNDITRTLELVSNLPKRIANLFERLGIECEWSDEWTSCDDCSALLRTQPDCHYWKPSYNQAGIEKGECVCLHCKPEEEVEEEE